MAEMDITRMSSKGQIVIPFEMRKDINEGDKIVIIKNNDQLILKKVDKFDKNLEEDLKAAKRAEEAWREIKMGHFKRMSATEFLNEIKSLK